MVLIHRSIIDFQCTATQAFLKRNDQDIVMFCGSPGAGKSTYFWTQLQALQYERVNQDILKTVSGPAGHGRISTSNC
jgi:predicted PilT family ATPase